MRLTVCLEGNTEGRVLASVDMEEIVKMTITDDVEKSNFNPQMLKSCTDTSYQCGYEQGRADELDKISKMILLGCEEMKCEECGYRMYSQDVCQQAYTIGIIENYISEQLKEQKDV